MGFMDKMLGREPKKKADFSDVQGGHSTTAREAAPARAPMTPMSTPMPTPMSTTTTSAAKTYTVQSGDSLSLIAKRLLGDMKRWPELFSLNKDVIGQDPDRIFPGQVLKLPG
jgi:nucleoid-associated protein YgaU